MRKQQSHFTPLARKDDLIVTNLADEVLVYDLKRDKAHCLNQTAASVWERCNGRTTVADIASRIGKELRVSVDERVVWLALDQLDKFHLLRSRPLKPANAPSLSRRELIRLGIPVALALPLIISVPAPTAAQTASCRANGFTNCTLNSQCCGGCCNRVSTPSQCRNTSGTGGTNRGTGVACSNGNNCCSNVCAGGVCTA
jgi:hypothetical protein